MDRPPAKGKTLVIGLGNPIASDDSVGLHVVRRLKAILANADHVDVKEDYWGGWRLMEQMIGYDRAIIVDAICTGAAPGTIHLLTVGAIPTQRSPSSHEANLSTALALGRLAGAQLPADENIRILAVEAQQVRSFGYQCTPAVEAAIPRAVDYLIPMLRPPDTNEA